jgi:hypothetical protein
MLIRVAAHTTRQLVLEINVIGRTYTSHAGILEACSRSVALNVSLPPIPRLEATWVSM